MSVYRNLVQAPSVEFMAYSKAVTGHTIPGEKVVYSVITKTYPAKQTKSQNTPGNNVREQVTHKKKGAPQPTVRFPGMNDAHSKAHPMMEKLRALLTKKGPPPGTLGHALKAHSRLGVKSDNPPVDLEGYSRMKEDLSWRGQSHLANRSHV
jgi:hypothetical protein